MQLQIAGLLAGGRVAGLRGALANEDGQFFSGKMTAKGRAKAVKNNDQSNSPAALAAMAEVREAMLKNPVFRAAARPKELFGMLVSRYRQGMAYGTHVDDAIMGGKRTDLSFTFFLSEPEDYDGGELVIEGNGGDEAIKLPAGSLFLYPSTSLHHVAEVTRGERLVVVGWVRSLIRDQGQREVLFDLDQTVAALIAAAAAAPVIDRILKTRNNLVRMWAED